MSVNPNIAIWTSDWHVAATEGETPVIGNTKPSEAAPVVAAMKAWNPALVIDTGDCKDIYGAGTGAGHDSYIRLVQSQLPWGTVNTDTTINAKYPILPGNHDEVNDYTAGSTDFSIFDSKFWPAPYHWTCDWTTPKVRFIAIHSYIIHQPDALQGFFQVDASETTWLSSQLAALPTGYKAIVCSHAAANSAFGNEIKDTRGGTTLLSILASNNTKVVAYLNGHRHNDMATTVINGITHFNGGSVAYTLGNPSSRGGFMPIEYLPGTNTLRFHYRYGPPSFYGRVAGYTPVDISLN